MSPRDDKGREGKMEQNLYFNELFTGLERMCPGGIGTRNKMMKFIPNDSEIVILDVGCGQGNSSIALAQRFPQARIIAIDTNQDYIRHLNQQVASLGLAKQVQGLVMSMEDMDFPPEQFDVIWAEGSIYVAGFENALESWKKFLRPGGLLLCNDLCWKENLVSSHYKAKIQAVFGDLDFYRRRGLMARNKGYHLEHEFVQPHSDWLEGYYRPLARRMDEMTEKYPDKEEVKEIISQLQIEIDLFLNYSPFYAYVYFVLKREE